jgi:hypothetical protein
MRLTQGVRSTCNAEVKLLGLYIGLYETLGEVPFTLPYLISHLIRRSRGTLIELQPLQIDFPVMSR